jgi:hypothetical protein
MAVTHGSLQLPPLVGELPKLFARFWIIGHLEHT